MGFLIKDEAGYRLTPDSQMFLVEGSPAYLGGMATFPVSYTHLDVYKRQIPNHGLPVRIFPAQSMIPCPIG